MSPAIGWAIFGASVIGLPAGCFIMGILTSGSLHDAHSAGYRRGRAAAYAEMARRDPTTAKPKDEGARLLDEIADEFERAALLAEWSQHS